MSQDVNGFFTSQLSCQLFSPLPHGFNSRLDSHPLSPLVAALVTSLYVFIIIIIILARCKMSQLNKSLRHIIYMHRTFNMFKSGLTVYSSSI